MEFLRVGMLLLFHVFFFSGYSQSRSLRPREKEIDTLKRAVRDLFMIYQEESLKTRLVGVIRGEAGKPLNENEDHVTNEPGQISSDGNFTGLDDISTSLLDTNKNGDDDDDDVDDDKKKDLLLRIYSILRKTSQKAYVNESDDEQDIENHRGEADDDSLSAYSKPNHNHLTLMPLNEIFPANPTNDSNINISVYGAINESKLMALANETRTNVDWSYIPYSTDSTTKLSEDDEMVLRNATLTTIDDVEFTNNMYPTDGGGGGQELFENKRNEQDIEYLPRTMSDEKRGDISRDEIRDENEKNHDNDFISIKRSKIDLHYQIVAHLENDTSTFYNHSTKESLDREVSDGGKYIGDDGDKKVDVVDDDDDSDYEEANNDDDHNGNIYVLDHYFADDGDDDDEEDDDYYDDDIHDFDDEGDDDGDDHADDEDDDQYDDEIDNVDGEDGGDINDDDDNDALPFVTKPNDEEHAYDNQRTYNRVFETGVYSHINEVDDNHHGRTSIEDRDAERFLRWMLRYILRRMDEGSKSERKLKVGEELLPSEDESSATIRRYLAKSLQKERTVASIGGEGSIESRNGGLTPTTNDRLRKGERPSSRLSLEEKYKDPGVLLQSIIKREDLERRNQIRDLVTRLRQRSEIARMKSTP
ncbi:protein PFC0760c-like isoform X2 [Lytechinus pictus]|uniref:protein PFC0760c-like isoform X2 n=1 Tax=Lytechinus pictus TaxID=7653 RepID=UPI0030B9FFD1